MGTKIDVKFVTGSREDRRSETAAQHDLARFQGFIPLRQLVGEPCHAQCGVAQHRRRDPGILDYAIAMDQRRYPAQIGRAGDGLTADNKSGAGGVVGYRVEHFARDTGLRK